MQQGPRVRWEVWLAIPTLTVWLVRALVPVATTWGWDESMHAELPAVRMLLALRGGDWAAFTVALAECQQYPFVVPLVLALAQAVFGIAESVCRTVACALFGLGLAATWALAARLARAPAPPAAGARGAGDDRDDARVPALALGLGALSPLALAYAPTLFLELPFAALLALTLGVWIGRRAADPERARRLALAAGALATVAFFTKFNYGVLLWGALAVDLACDLALALPRRELRAVVRRDALLLPIPLLALLWWFVAPFPLGGEWAVSHRAAFVGFLTGNTQAAAVPVAHRLLHAASYLCPSPLAALGIGAGLALSLRHLRRAAVRTVWIALLVFAGALLAHPFHLDRFLLPLGPLAWSLAALGLVAGRSRRAAAVTTALLLVGVAGAPAQTAWLADRLGLLPAEPQARAHARAVLRGWNGMPGARQVPTAGLRREEAQRILDLLAGELGPDECVGWLGISAELSPAALHLGLLERGGSARRFLEQAHRPLYFWLPHTDPGWSDEQLAAWASAFDAIVMTEPPSFKAQPSREFVRAYQKRLVDELGYRAERLGTVEIARPPLEPQRVVLHVCRRER